jgi:cytochrome d ubiquinol oxidase subunit I
MEDLLFARLQMAVSLGFHIIFACIGMTMPFFMATAEYKYNKTGQPVYLELAKAWSKGVAIFFAVGAVSGTVLSFELGLLWPGFMEHAGPIFGMPFSWEGTAFFLEAIALGLFLYGWKRLNKWLHWFVGLFVGISGVASGIFVVAANAWMNSPAGFDWDPITGKAYNIDPWAAMFNDAWFSQALHMTLAAFVATGFAVAGIHALLLLKDKTNVFHQHAFKIAAVWGGIFAILIPFSGDYAAKDVAERQPIKLAAMESHFNTEAPAPLILGGIPNEETGTVDYAIKIPGALSFLAYGNFDAEVKGLNDFPRENWPPVAITHYGFQIMVGIGSLLMIISIIFFFLYWRKRDKLYSNKILKLFAIVTPLGFIAVEAGWTVTEVGRQPWIIYGIMKTADSVTPMPGLVVPFALFTLLYLFLSVVVIWLLKRQIKAVEIKFKDNPETIIDNA